MRRSHAIDPLALFMTAVCFVGIAALCTAAEGRRVACLGDEITLGPRAPDAREQAYPAQLQYMLGTKWTVRNFGIPGATVTKSPESNLWTNIPSVTAFSPDFIVIMLGTEDTCGPPRNNWSRVGSFERDCAELVTRLRDAPGKPQILVCSPTAMVMETPGLSEARRAEIAARKPRIQELRKKLRRVAAIKGVNFVDLNTALQGRPELMREGDGINPNVYGFNRIAEFMAGVLWRLSAGQTPARPDKPYKKDSRNVITLAQAGKLDEADQQVTRLLTEWPTDPEAHFLRAIVRAMMGKPADAIEATRRALAAGLPFERFLAGPRLLLKELYGQLEFWEIAKSYNLRLVHGPVLGQVTDRSAAFWFRTSVEDRVAVSIRDKDSGRPVALGTGRTREDRDFTCVVTVSGLKPDTVYSYQVLVADRRIFADHLPEFRTAPPTGTSSRFSIAFGGGAGYTPWNERMWDTIRAQSPRALLLLGDNVYIDTPTVPETQRYCYYRRQSRPEYKRLTEVTPVYAIWDDHDFGDNDCTSTLAPNDPPWKPAVLDVFRENWVNPYYGACPRIPGVWHDFSLGDVDFFMLDCRYYRQDPEHVERPSMLGPTQKAWLKQKLKYSKAAFKVICSSVPWAYGTKPGSKDTWDGFPHERAELMAFIQAKQVDGVVLLSADRHRSDIREIQLPAGYSLYDFTSSRLTNVHVHKILPGSVFAYNEKCSFGMLDFDTTKPDPEVTLRIVSIDGEPVYSMTLKRSQLSVPTHRGR